MKVAGVVAAAVAAATERSKWLQLLQNSNPNLSTYT